MLVDQGLGRQDRPSSVTWCRSWRCSRMQLPFDPREQVVDVVALEHAVAQRVEHLAALGRRVAAVEQRVPARRQLVELLLRARRAWPRSAAARARAGRASSSARRAARRAARAPRRAPRSARTLPRAAPAAPACDASSGSARRQPFELQQVLDARDRLLAACGTRRSGTTTARGWRAARPASRCRSSPG